ncbi:MAG: hypothetical protein PHY02_09590 [Phycisphaerae bacterium]|nr:hypothetical protein [Phycisphaerae bacterium]
MKRLLISDEQFEAAGKRLAEKGYDGKQITETFKKYYRIFNWAIGLLMAVILIGDDIELFKKFIGVLAYPVGFLLSPIFAPALLFLPWYDAWVNGGAVNRNVLFIWAVFYINLAILLIVAFSKRKTL